MSCVS